MVLTYAQPPLLSASPTTVVHLMGLCWLSPLCEGSSLHWRQRKRRDAEKESLCRSFTNQLQERAKLFKGTEMAPAEAWGQRQKSFPVVIFLDKRRQAGVSTHFSLGVLLLQSWMRGPCLMCSVSSQACSVWYLKLPVCPRATDLLW